MTEINNDFWMDKWHKECAYAYFFEKAPFIGEKTMKNLYMEYNSYQAVYEELIKGRLNSFLRLDGKISDKKQEKKQAIFSHAEKWNVKEQYQKLLAQHIFCLPRELVGYPEKLKEIHQAPSALFVKGKMPDEKRPAVAIIGARNCSGYGAMMAKELGEKLAENGIGIVSGMARGIDGIGQTAALNKGGATFGIIGCGVDICYPEENRSLFKRLEQGEGGSGIISEFAPGVPAEKKHFPMRNRIISGLSDAIVVIEAKEKSGTFITVERALEQGKNVYALPGRLCDRLSYGCNRLIGQGAGVIFDVNEFIREIYENKQYEQEKGHLTIKPISQLDKHMVPGFLNDVQRRIYKLLDLQFQSVDTLLEQNDQIPFQQMLVELSDMECKGIVENVNGFYRIRVE